MHEGVDGLQHLCPGALPDSQQTHLEAVLPRGQFWPCRYMMHAVSRQRLHPGKSWGATGACQRHDAQALAKVPPPGPAAPEAARAAPPARRPRRGPRAAAPRPAAPRTTRPRPPARPGRAALPAPRRPRPPPPPPARRAAGLLPGALAAAALGAQAASTARPLKARAASTARRLASLELPS
jgi:hypothetical protein